MILLTDEFPNVPCERDRLHVEPPRDTPADRFDFTDPEKLRRTWEFGRRDGAGFLERHGATESAH